MRRAFETYQYLAPAVLTPLGAWLWWRHYDGNLALAAIALRRADRARLYRARHRHQSCCASGSSTRGCGSDAFGRTTVSCSARATAMLMLLVIGEPTAHPTIARRGPRPGCSPPAFSAPSTGSTTAAAIRAGILKVYNQPWADGRGPRSIAVDYAPWFFGGFGLIHGAGLKLAEGALLTDADPLRAVAIGWRAPRAATATLPTLGYIAQSYWRHGHHGCRPVAAASRRVTMRWLDPAIIERLASDPARRMRMPDLGGLDLSQAVRAGGVHAALLHAALSPACIASTGCATTSSSACASTNTS